MLATYRKHCANPSMPGQLILPECLKLLPLYANCVLRSDAVAGTAELTPGKFNCLIKRNGLE